MAIDMPPAPPVYEIERPAPAISLASALLASSIAAARHSSATKSPVMLDLDTSSRAMSSHDKMAAMNAKQTLQSGEVVMDSNGIPDSYVGERLKLAMAQVRVNESVRDGSATDLDSRQLRCRMIAMTLDKRAGAYVVGGERAADEARKSIPVAAIEECKAAARKDAILLKSFKESDVISSRDTLINERPALQSYRQASKSVQVSSSAKNAFAANVISGRGY